MIIKDLDIITVYEVYEPYDKTEQRGINGSVSLGFFSNLNVAKYVEQNEATGYSGTISGVGIKEVKIYTGSLDNYKWFYYYKKEDIRQRALSKLTDEEKEALGF